MIRLTLRPLRCERSTAVLIEPSALKPGDHLLIEATQDTEGFFYAVNVIFQKQGTAAERIHDHAMQLGGAPVGKAGQD